MKDVISLPGGWPGIPGEGHRIPCRQPCQLLGLHTKGDKVDQRAVRFIPATARHGGPYGYRCPGGAFGALALLGRFHQFSRCQ